MILETSSSTFTCRSREYRSTGILFDLLFPVHRKLVIVKLIPEKFSLPLSIFLLHLIIIQTRFNSL